MSQAEIVPVRVSPLRFVTLTLSPFLNCAIVFCYVVAGIAPRRLNLCVNEILNVTAEGINVCKGADIGGFQCFSVII